MHRQRCRYDPSKMAAAISMARGGMPLAKAARLFEVPRSTLQDKIKGRVPEEATRPGPQPVLTQAEEKTVVEYAKLMAEIGYPLTRKELTYEVKRILDVDGRKTPFKDNLPGRGWFKAFTMRNNDFTERNPAALGHQRAVISMGMIRSWYDGLQSFLEKEVEDFKSMIADPRRIFNADESGFPISVKSSKVLAPKGSKHVYQVQTSDKSQITVMACFNAFGNYMPPLIVYPGQRFRDTLLTGFPEAIYGHSANGWMDAELFTSFVHHFHTYVKEQNIPLPVILFVDGHSTHMSLPTAKFCSENGIILYCLLENATHILQACDIGLFSPLKSRWQAKLKDWQMQHIGEVFTKSHFPEVFKTAWESVTTVQNSISAFRRSGLFPLNPEGIDQSKLGPSKLSTTSESSPSTSTSPPITAAGDCTAVITNITEHHLNIPSVSHTNLPVSSGAVSQSDPASLSQHVDSTSPSVPVTNVGNASTCHGLSAFSLMKKRDPAYVSPCFEALRIPEPKIKKKPNTLRAKLPKALSGSEALRLMREREENKAKEELAKAKRREERELKKREREEEKERKKRERELKKKIKLAQKKNTATTESESETEIMYMDESDYDESVVCPGCKSSEGREQEWLGCDLCPRWWHIECIDREDFYGKNASDLKGVAFVCEMCE